MANQPIDLAERARYVAEQMLETLTQLGDSDKLWDPAFYSLFNKVFALEYDLKRIQESLYVNVKPQS